MILVAGGTGRLGTLVVRKLVEKGRPVRVLTRDPRRAEHLDGLAVDVRRGDVRQAASLREALHGVETVISLIHGFTGPGHGSPASVDRDGNAHLIDAAGGVGADVVLMSVVGADREHPLELFRMKAAAEDHLRANGCGWTIVRATAFAELYLELLGRSAGRSGRPVVFGRGENPINFVSVGDVASVVASAAVDPEVRGQILEVGGPADLTMNQLAALAQRRIGAIGQPVRHVPRALLRTVAGTGHIVSSRAARLTGAALTMDSADMTFSSDRSDPARPRGGTTVGELVR